MTTVNGFVLDDWQLKKLTGNLTDRDILEAAIMKAIDGGWKPEYEYKDIAVDENGIIVYAQKFAVGYSTLIFNHDFAKALWGEEKLDRELASFGEPSHLIFVSDPATASFNGENWQYHLQQMVIADDPIKYLGENI